MSDNSSKFEILKAFLSLRLSVQQFVENNL